jgi:hypothetical protein
MLRHVKEGFGNEASVRGNWREGSYSGDSERHVMEESGNTAFLLLGSKRGT